MKKFYWVIIILQVLAGISSCVLDGYRIRGNGKVISQSRSLGAFSGIQVAGSMNVYIRQGTPGRANVEAESNLLPYIVTRIEGNMLIIKTRSNTWIQSSRDINVYVTAPDLEEIGLSGSGNIYSQGQLQNSRSIDFQVTGSGTVKAEVNTPDVKATETGSGDLDLSGQTRDIRIRIAGSGSYNGQQLQGEEVSADILGSGNARVNASKQLKATIIGSGNIYYLGSPGITTHVVGSGSVIRQ